MDLTDCQLSKKGINFVLEGAILNTSINYLNLSKNLIGIENLNQVSKLIGKNQILRSFILDSTAILFLDNFGFRESFMKTQISKLYLKNNNYNNSNHLSFLKDVMLLNLSIIQFNLKGNEINEQGCPFLASIIFGNNVLEILNLNLNKINSEGAIILFNSLSRNKSIKILKLKSNLINMDACYILMDFINEKSIRSEVILIDNKIDERTIFELYPLIKIFN